MTMLRYERKVDARKSPASIRASRAAMYTSATVPIRRLPRRSSWRLRRSRKRRSSSSASVRGRQKLAGRTAALRRCLSDHLRRVFAGQPVAADPHRFASLASLVLRRQPHGRALVALALHRDFVPPDARLRGVSAPPERLPEAPRLRIEGASAYRRDPTPERRRGGGDQAARSCSASHASIASSR